MPARPTLNHEKDPNGELGSAPAQTANAMVAADISHLGQAAIDRGRGFPADVTFVA